jgi:predicted outer membrane repeat protein
MNALTRAKSAFLVAFLVLGLLGPVRANTTYYVGNDGAVDFRTIQEAVNAAATGDIVRLLPGYYTGSGNWNIVVTGKAITVTSVDPNDPAVVASTVIDCRGTDTIGHRAFAITENSGVHLTLAGLTITNGATIYHGGAIWCQDAGLTVINCTFTNNRAEWRGGAVCCVNSSSTFRGCTFSNGSSGELTGGAVYCGNSVVSFTRCTFDSNIGGAIVGRESGLTLMDCTFEGNVGEDGGALHTYAGLSNQDAYLNMTRCVFISNVSNTSGGAFYGINAQGKIDACTFMANTTATADGGAIYTRHSSPTISNSVFVSNIAAGIGGAIANSFESAPQIVNCTLVANQATGGGGVASSHNANPLISHSILWDNVAATGPSLYLKRIDATGGYTASTTILYSNVKNGPAGTYTDSGCTLIWGVGNINSDPLFTGPFRNDYRLSTDSPCIDAGNPNNVPAAGATDLDGYPRLYGAAVDMGAYEYQGLGPVYRFWSPVKLRHFYTISGAERDTIMREYAHLYTYEDVAFYASYHPSEKGQAPVYRFWSPKLETHFWTIDEAEKDAIIKDMADTWEFEGAVFYAYPSGSQPLGTFPVYRFWSDRLRQHFYTMDEQEKEYVIKAYAGTWAYESVAWYAFTKPFQAKQETYNFTGGANDVWYALTLKAYVNGEEALIDASDVQLIPTLAEMQMSVDFTNLTATFKTLRVQTQTMQHAATITTQSGSVAIPMTLSIGAAFTALTQRGPFAVDPVTGVFADFTKANQSLTANQAMYTYTGSATLGNTIATFTRVSSALQFELKSFGVFEGFNQVPHGLDARMPLTFQWHRPHVRDVLVEASVDGRLVQIYVTYVYVGTQGTWEGLAVE